MEENKRILLITKSPQSFLITALIKSLNDAGYEVSIAYPTVFTIAAAKENGPLPNIFLVYLEDYEEVFEQLFPYLKTLLTQDGTIRRMYLIGNKIEFNAVYKYIGKDWISHTFERPVNSADLIKQLEMQSAGYSYDEDNLSKKNTDFDPSRKTLLLVDDDSTFLRSMERWFSKFFNVITADSGKNVVPLLKKVGTVDLILLDYKMPIVSGLEVFQMIKSEPDIADIPVIFLTAKDDKETVTEVLSAGPEKYFLKNKPPSILLQNIQDFFEEKERKKAEAELNIRY